MHQVAWVLRQLLVNADDEPDVAHLASHHFGLDIKRNPQAIAILADAGAERIMQALRPDAAPVATAQVRFANQRIHPEEVAAPRMDLYGYGKTEPLVIAALFLLLRLQGSVDAKKAPIVLALGRRVLSEANQWDAPEDFIGAVELAVPPSERPDGYVSLRDKEQFRNATEKTDADPKPDPSQLRDYEHFDPRIHLSARYRHALEQIIREYRDAGYELSVRARAMAFIAERALGTR